MHFFYASRNVWVSRPFELGQSHEFKIALPHDRMSIVEIARGQQMVDEFTAADVQTLDILRQLESEGLPNVRWEIMSRGHDIILRVTAPHTIDDIEMQVRTLCASLQIPLDQDYHTTSEECPVEVDFEGQIRLNTDRELAEIETRFAAFMATGILSRANLQRMRANRHLDPEVFQRLGEFQLLACSVPTEYGGQGLGIGAAMHIGRLLTSLDVGLGLSYVATALLGENRFLEMCPDAERKKAAFEKVARGELRFFIAMTEVWDGSRFKNWKTEARRNDDGSITIDGSKSYSTGAAVGNEGVVYVKMQERGCYSAVMLDPKKEVSVLELQNSPGCWARGPKEEKFGAHTAELCDLYFNQYLVAPEDILAMNDAMPRIREGLKLERAALACQVMGIIDRLHAIAMQRIVQRGIGDIDAVRLHASFIEGKKRTMDAAINELISQSDLHEQHPAHEEYELDEGGANAIVNELTQSALEVAITTIRLEAGKGFVLGGNEALEALTGLMLFFTGGGTQDVRAGIAGAQAPLEFKPPAHLKAPEKYPLGALVYGYKYTALPPTFIDAASPTLARVQQAAGEHPVSCVLREISDGVPETGCYLEVTLDEAAFPDKESREALILSIDRTLLGFGLWRQVAGEPAIM